MPRTKARYGTGSKKYKGLDKHGVEKWLLRVDDGLNAEGKRNRPGRMFHGTPAQADKALALYYAEVVTGKVSPKPAREMTVREWAAEYLTLRAKAGLAAKTLKGYRDHLENRILPALGNTPLSKLTRQHVKQFLRMLEDEPAQGPRAKNREKPAISGATQLAHFNTLRALLREAVYHDLIATNPARDVRPPKAEKPHARFFDSHALDKLLAALTLQHPRNYALWLLALGVGMRRGEFTALRWDHIRWREGLIIVEQSIEYIAREGEHVKDTKTDAGMRLIPLPEHVRQALEYCLVQQHLDYHAWEARKLRRPHKVTNWRDSDYVFTRSTNGGRLHIEYISTLFQRFLTDHNLPPIGLHSLRHTAISIWRSGGLSDVDAAALAGHESPTTTNIYSHALTEPLRRSATIMDNMLGTKLGTKACASDVSREGTPTR